MNFEKVDESNHDPEELALFDDFNQDVNEDKKTMNLTLIQMVGTA